MTPTTTIKLQSADDIVFNVDVDVAKLSKVLKTMIEDLGLSDGDVIPLPQVNGAVLQKVLEWCSYHKYDPDPEFTAESDFYHVTHFEVPEWDQEFLKADRNKLLEVIMAANYLDVKGLLRLSSMTAAKLISGKPPEEIRALFEIENDLEDCHNEC